MFYVRLDNTETSIIDTTEDRGEAHTWTDKGCRVIKVLCDKESEIVNDLKRYFGITIAVPVSGYHETESDAMEVEEYVETYFPNVRVRYFGSWDEDWEYGISIVS